MLAVNSFVLPSGRIRINQQGFSLIETMVGMAVATLLLGGLTTIVYRAAQGVSGNNSQVSVYRQMENAATFIGGDANMAKFTDLAEGATANLHLGNTVSLEWTDYYQDQNLGHRAYYYMSGTDLMRDYDGDVTVAGKSMSSVSFTRGTTAAKTDRLITVTMTTSATEGPSQSSNTKTFRFNLRPQT